jgi:uncharacterized protein (TIGR03437 family)
VVAQGRDGNLYSTTMHGGALAPPGVDDPAYGTIFRVTPSGTMTVVYTFRRTTLANPYNPQSGLTLGTDGFFYGAGAGSVPASKADGKIFKTDSSGNVSVLYTLAGSDGIGAGAPIRGTDGSLYGVTQQGGGVYKLTPDGKFSVIHVSDPTDGDIGPLAPLFQATDGNFYGTTVTGSQSTSFGTVFRVTNAGDFAFIYKFDNIHGAKPIGAVIQASDGNLYGTTSAGGASGFGTVFMLTPLGSLTVLHSFNGTDGKTPNAGLVQANNGVFYGVTSAGGAAGLGTLFKITSTGAFSVLHNFDNSTGATPTVALVQHTNGVLYGDTFAGGANGAGVFFSLNDSLQPFVSLQSLSGPYNTSIGILGQGFTGTTSVSFNGGSAAFTVVSDTFLTATVPIDGVTGKVTVTGPKGTLTSDKVFTVIPVITSVLNIGSYTSSLAPGSAAAVFGTDLGSNAGAGALVGGQAAQVMMATATQWTLAIPYNAVTGASTIQIGTAAFPITLGKYAPGLFSADGTGQGNALAQRVLSGRTTAVSAAAPAIPGDTIVLFATGLGAIDGSGNSMPLPAVTVGGQAATVVSAIAGSTNPGTYQVTIRLPGTTPSGNLPVVLSIGGASSQSLTLPVGALTGPLITDVQNGASFLPGVATNTWLTIKGGLLASTTDTWANAIVNGNLPTTLDNVSVKVGGQPAYIYFISPGQINVVAPDIGAGPITVTVTNGAATSAPFNATAQIFGPAFFLWPGGYAVATRTDYTNAVRNGTFSGSPTVAPKPGDVLILWGTGFGPTNPAAPVGVQIPPNSYPTASNVTVTIGGATAIVYGAALAPGFSALYQVALQVPEMPDGDYPLIATVNGVSSPNTTLLTVKH